MKPAIRTTQTDFVRALRVALLGFADKAVTRKGDKATKPSKPEGRRS